MRNLSDSAGKAPPRPLSLPYAGTCPGPRTPDQSLRVAGYIHDPPGPDPHRSLQELLAAPAPGRIHEQHVRLIPVCSHLPQEFPRVLLVETDIGDLIALRIAYGIPDGLPVQLHPQHLGRLSAGDHADGTGSAVSVQDCLLPCKPCVLHDLFIQLPGLDRIHLIEGFGGYPECHAAELILNVPLAVYHLLLLPQHHAGILVIDIDHYGGDLRVELQQGLHEILLGGHHRISQHQHHHDLSGGMPYPDQHMAQQPNARILIVWPYLE